MKKLRKRIGYGGFTLIELLGLIVIITLVAVLLIPILQRRRSGCTRSNCISNLRQIGLLTSMYADLYQGRCPTDSDIPTLVGTVQLYSNIVGSAKLFFCSYDKRGGKPQLSFNALTTRRGAQNISYSYVPNLMWSTNETPDVILALDRIYTTRAGSPWPKDGNHKEQRGCILYNEGRVEFVDKLPQALKDKNGREIVLSP